VGALALVLMSYLTGLLPGFFYALVLGSALLAVPGDNRRRPALLAAAGLGALLVMGLIFWALSIPTDLALRNLGYGAEGGLGALGATVVDVLQALFALIFFVALQGAFFELLPVGNLSGGYLFRWSGIVWGIASFLVSALMMHTLINPLANAPGLAHNRAVLALAGGLAFYTFVALVVWLTVHGRGLAGLSKEGAPLARKSLVALALTIALWIVVCACGLISAAWGSLAAR
jgi:hypothetical protein